METIYAIWISAIATGVIAISTVMNVWLILRIKSRDDEFRNQVRDLYQAIIISNLVDPRIAHGALVYEGAIKLFKEFYKGKTRIFD